MINSQRQRELTMQVTRFLDDRQDFPSDLTPEEGEFVDRLISVHEMLLANPQFADHASAAVSPVVSGAARQIVRASEAHTSQSLPNTGETTRRCASDAVAIGSDETGDSRYRNARQCGRHNSPGRLKASQNYPQRQHQSGSDRVRVTAGMGAAADRWCRSKDNSIPSP